MTCVEVDYNERSPEGWVRAGYEDATGPLVEGLCVSVSMPDDGTDGVAVVERLDPKARLVYLDVDWSSIQAAGTPRPFPRRVTLTYGFHTT